jgi:hypothetical protein
MTFDPNAIAVPDIQMQAKTLEPVPERDVTFPLRHMKGMYDDIVVFLRDPEPYHTLAYEGGLLELPDFDWCNGSWTVMKKEGGWRDELNGKQFVSVEQVRDAIERRIQDLGLDRELIEAYGAPRPYQEATIANVNAALQRLRNQQAWESLPFNERMSRFRRGVQ